MVAAPLSKWQGWSGGGGGGGGGRGRKERGTTHVPSDVESINHDHLLESEITTRPPVSRGACKKGPGNGRRDGKGSRDPKGGKKEKMREKASDK